MEQQMTRTPLEAMPPLNVVETGFSAADMTFLDNMHRNPLGIETPAQVVAPGRFDAVRNAGFGAGAPELRPRINSRLADELDLGGLENVLAVEKAKKRADLEMQIKAAAHIAVINFFGQGTVTEQIARANLNTDDDD